MPSALSQALREATAGMYGPSFLYLASIICVFGLMVVVTIWQLRGGPAKPAGQARQDKGRSRVSAVL